VLKLNILNKIHFSYKLYILILSDESNDKVEILFNAGGTPVKAEIIGTDSREKKVRKSRGGRQKKNASNREQQEKMGAIATICSFWNVLTFSWMRPLMVIGTAMNLFYQPRCRSDFSHLKPVSSAAANHHYWHTYFCHLCCQPAQNI
jgi:hypothetical protein